MVALIASNSDRHRMAEASAAPAVEHRPLAKLGSRPELKLYEVRSTLLHQRFHPCCIMSSNSVPSCISAAS